MANSAKYQTKNPFGDTARETKINDRRAFAEELEEKDSGQRMLSQREKMEALMKRWAEKEAAETGGSQDSRFKELEAENARLREELKKAKEAVRPLSRLKIAERFGRVKNLAKNVLEATHRAFLMAVDRPLLTTGVLAAATLAAVNHATLHLPGIEQHVAPAAAKLADHMRVAGAHLSTAHEHIKAVVENTNLPRHVAKIQEHMGVLKEHVAKVLNHTPVHKVAQHVNEVHNAVAHFTPQTFYGLDSAKEHINDSLYNYAHKALSGIPGGEKVLEVFHPSHDLPSDGLSQSFLVGELNDPSLADSARKAIETKFNFIDGLSPKTLHGIESCFTLDPNTETFTQIKPIPDALKHQALVETLNHIRENGTELVKASQSFNGREAIDPLSNGAAPHVNADQVQGLLTNILDKLHHGAKLYAEQIKEGVKVATELNNDGFYR